MSELVRQQGRELPQNGERFVSPLALLPRVILIAATLACSFYLNVSQFLQMGESGQPEGYRFLTISLPFILVASMLSAWLFEKPRLHRLRVRGLGVGLLAAILTVTTLAVPITMGSIRVDTNEPPQYIWALGMLNYLFAPCAYFGAVGVLFGYILIDHMERRRHV
jgi:hypothetical protein